MSTRVKMASSSPSSSLGLFSSPSAASLPPDTKDGEYGSWAELPPELTSSIMLRLGAVDILENAQKVCTSWRRVSKDPLMWRKIDMRNPGDLGSMPYDLEVMCRHAVDRSQGGLLEIDIWHFATDKLLNYIADSTSNLKSLRIANCNRIPNKGFVEAVVKLPLLEELEVSYCSLSGESLKVIGQSCPNLKTLKLNDVGTRDPIFQCDDDALAIAETMPGLSHLQLFGNLLSNTGLDAILDNCPNLEHLDLRQCFHVNLVGDLEKRCSERIKVVRRPNDSTHDYPFDATVDEFSSSDDYGSDDDDLEPSDGGFVTSDGGHFIVPDGNSYYGFCSDSDNMDYDPYHSDNSDSDSDCSESSDNDELVS